jgi:hypothetical protein
MSETPDRNALPDWLGGGSYSPNPNGKGSSHKRKKLGRRGAAVQSPSLSRLSHVSGESLCASPLPGVLPQIPRARSQLSAAQSHSSQLPRSSSPSPPPLLSSALLTPRPRQLPTLPAPSSRPTSVADSFPHLARNGFRVDQSHSSQTEISGIVLHRSTLPALSTLRDAPQKGLRALPPIPPDVILHTTLQMTALATRPRRRVPLRRYWGGPLRTPAKSGCSTGATWGQKGV